MGRDEAKRKLRKLKQIEKKIRRVGTDAKPDLVWNDFFTVKYPLDIVAAMDRETYKRVVEEYFYYVYYRLDRENNTGAFYDPEILSRLGLPPFAGEDMIRARFRELAKLYHPDAGGSAADFIKLKENYDDLLK